jgi:hypothetical protein
VIQVFEVVLKRYVFELAFEVESVDRFDGDDISYPPYTIIMSPGSITAPWP